jgi:DNA-binding XRE family transcriptional regulator
MRDNFFVVFGFLKLPNKTYMIENDEHTAEIEVQIRRIAQRLREEREKTRISQIDLSFLAGLSQNQVFCIETGRRTPKNNFVRCQALFFHFFFGNCLTLFLFLHKFLLNT